MRAQRPVPFRPCVEGIIVRELPLDGQVPHRVAPRRRHRRRARGAREWGIQPGRARDDVRARKGERRVDECAQLRAPGRVCEEAAGEEARPEVELWADCLL